MRGNKRERNKGKFHPERQAPASVAQKASLEGMRLPVRAKGQRVEVEGKGDMIEGITDRIDRIPGALALKVAVRPVGLVSTIKGKGEEEDRPSTTGHSNLSERDHDTQRCREFHFPAGGTNIATPKPTPGKMRPRMVQDCINR
jgi:hypothetical protein